jgi:UTP--glucose-1-phosphate uridylyltransferase
MKYLQGVGPSVQWEKIEPLPKDAVRSYSSLKAPPKDKIKSMLNQLVVVKLNGGLGMTFDYFLNQKRFKRLNI